MSGEKDPIPGASVPDGALAAAVPNGEQETVPPSLLDVFYGYCKDFGLDATTEDPGYGPRLASEIHNYFQAGVDDWNRRWADKKGWRTASIPDLHILTRLEEFYGKFGVTPPPDDYTRQLREDYLEEGRAAALNDELRKARYVEIRAVEALAIALDKAGHKVASDSAYVLLATIGKSFGNRP